MSFSSKSLDASRVLCLRGDTLAFPWASPCIIYPSGGSPMVSISHTLFFYCLTFCPPLSIVFPFLCLVLFHYLCSSWDGVQVYVNNSHAVSYYVLYKTTLNSDLKMGVDFRRTIKARAPSRTSVHPLAVPAGGPRRQSYRECSAVGPGSFPLPWPESASLCVQITGTAASKPPEGSYTVACGAQEAASGRRFSGRKLKDRIWKSWCTESPNVSDLFSKMEIMAWKICYEC